MFCPSCGNSVTDGLKYCSSCGLQLLRDREGSEEAPNGLLKHLLTTLVFVVVFGLAILVGLVAVMLGNNVKTDIVMMVAFGYLLAIFGISFTLARQVPKLIDSSLKGKTNRSGVFSPLLLETRTTAQLDEYRQPVASVTDHTTKTLDKVLARKY